MVALQPNLIIRHTHNPHPCEAAILRSAEPRNKTKIDSWVWEGATGGFLLSEGWILMKGCESVRRSGGEAPGGVQGRA